MPTEYSLKDEINDRLKVCQKRRLRIWFLKIHGHRMQRGGVPDFVVCYQGRFKAIELKREDQQPTPLQINEMRGIIWAGGYADVAHSWTEFCEKLQLPSWCLEVPRH